jgi:hypothetical protein
MALRCLIKSLNDKPVVVAYPAGFDFLFVYHLMRFVGESPFDTGARREIIRDGRAEDGLPKAKGRRWALVRQAPALACRSTTLIEQGALFCNMLNENRVAEHLVRPEWTSGRMNPRITRRLSRSGTRSFPMIRHGTSRHR